MAVTETESSTQFAHPLFFAAAAFTASWSAGMPNPGAAKLPLTPQFDAVATCTFGLVPNTADALTALCWGLKMEVGAAALAVGRTGVPSTAAANGDEGRRRTELEAGGTEPDGGGGTRPGGSIGFVVSTGEVWRGVLGVGLDTTGRFLLGAKVSTSVPSAGDSTGRPDKTGSVCLAGSRVESSGCGATICGLRVRSVAELLFTTGE